MKGKVQTVLGEIEPSQLGRVLTHEHLEIDVLVPFRQHPLIKPELENCDFSLKNLGWIRQFPYSHRPNMVVEGSDVQIALQEEMKKFKSLGGGTVVDNTTVGISLPNRVSLGKKISRETGVHIILGTGYYVNGSQDSAILDLSVEAMSERMTKDLTKGTEEDSTVKCGILGEVGCSWPLTDFEKRSVRASAEVEQAVGCPVMIHPGRNHKAPEEIVRIYSEAGGNRRRLVMAHLDRTLHTNEDILEFSSMGTLLEYDLFGIETSYYQIDESLSMPSDAQRIQRIKLLIDEGHEDRILLSHDIHTKHRMEAFGGHGFSHILTIVVPMMLKRGISQETIDKFLIHNPANWLAFTK